MEQGRHLRAAFPPGGAGERHAEDVLRVALGVAIVAVSAWACQGRRPSTFEVNVFQAGYDLPGYTGSVWLGLMQLGSLTAVPVVAVVALLGRRVWLALAVAVSGTAAWAAAKVLQGVVDGRSPQAALHVALRGGVSLGPTFPATQVAVAAAMATVAGSRLSGPTRRLCWLAVAAVGVARLYVGAQFPLEIAAGVALGWAVGACFNLAVGAPRGLPPVTSVRRALEDGGVNPVTLEAVGSSEKGSAVFRAVGGRGAIHVKVVGRDLPADDWLSRAWRLLAFRELDADQARSAAHRVERDAYLTLAARQRGVPTTTVVFTRHFGTRASLLATAWVPGTTLDRLPSPAPDGEALRNVWLVIPVLRASRIAHGSLQAPNVIVGPDGAVTLVGFGAGSEAANPDQLDGDIADLLVSTAAIFGPGRAVDAAVDALGRPQMSAVMARLQPLALSRLSQAVLRRHKGLLDDLRRHLAQETGAANDAVQRPVRVAVGNLVPLGAALFAVNLLLPRVSQVGATVSALHHADGRWLPAIIAAAAATYPMAAVALTGAADRALVFGRTLAVQMAAAFTNRLAPAGLGGMATNVRYLELSGSSRPAAVNAVVLTSAAGLFVHLVAGIAVGLALGFERGPTAPHPPALPPHWPALLVVAAVIIAAGIPLWGRALRRLIVPHLAQLRDAVAGLRRHPKSIAQLVGGSAGITASHTVALIACTKAFGLGLPALDVAGIYLAATAVAALAPTPGGVGALEAVLVAALTEAGGATGAAVAAVLTYRLATYWLPIVPGAATFYTLRHRQDL